MPELILASASPRRSELLDQLGLAHRCIPADVDETTAEGERAVDYVRRLSLAKARAVAADHPGHWVVGSDTAVILDEAILGKPANRDQGIDMLRRLGGRSHQVLTGVALVNGEEHYRLSRSVIRFRPVSAAEAAAYWETGEPADKAGGYAIQGRAACFVEHLSGSFSGVMGLPLFELDEVLRAVGFDTLQGRPPGPA